MLMLLPPHTTMTTGPRLPANLPSSCSLLMMPLYTAARAAPQAGSTRTFSSSTHRRDTGGDQSHCCLLSCYNVLLFRLRLYSPTKLSTAFTASWSVTTSEKTVCSLTSFRVCAETLVRPSVVATLESKKKHQSYPQEEELCENKAG